MAMSTTKTTSQTNPKKGALQKKILLLLSAGLALGLTRNPNQYFRIVQETGKEWKNIERDSLNRAIRSLYESKLVSIKDNHDGTLTLVLSKEGKRLALTYDIENIELKTPTQWDGRWRIAMFDVPEKYKRTRDALRMHLKNIGFYEFQKSVFVHPHPCAKEIEYITEFYQARRFVRFIVATEIDNALEESNYGITDIILKIDLLQNVSPDKSIREAAQRAINMIQNKMIAIERDPKIWQALKDYEKGVWRKEQKTLDTASKKLFHDMFLEYKRLGFDLPAKKQSLKRARHGGMFAQTDNTPKY
ncbi:MAG: hypothetical protein HY221_02195 [Candidatus Sungbacteria bacterium]|uniref:Transcriptional repressor PaaX-like central Cas2-like domain-containing protein n=1 Tax=Candidatus Sungiibacteriota bacterium TaxID=2750080 RepID=A0A932VRX3_9BACT|nr:hypothetical protein [Candidatus Sungbacteria bacterium]